MLRRSAEVLRLFDELIEQGEAIKDLCKKLYFSGNKKTIAPEIYESWRTNCLSLLKSTFGSSSPHYDNFANLKFFDYYNSCQIYLGILKGARTAIGKGYFFHKDLMLSVSIYDSLISRAKTYAQRGELNKAQALLETILTEILAKICANRRLEHDRGEDLLSLVDKLGKAELVPGEVKQKLVFYNSLFNRPSSGSNGEELISAADWILSFLNEYLSSQIVILN